MKMRNKLMILFRRLFWEMHDMKDEVVNAINVSEARTQMAVVQKLDELASVIRHENVHQENRLRSSIRQAVKDELRDKLYTKEVRRSVEDLEEGKKEKKFKARSEHEAEYAAEESRVVAELKKDAESINKMKEMAAKLRASKPVRARRLRKNEKDEENEAE